MYFLHIRKDPAINTKEYYRIRHAITLRDYTVTRNIVTGHIVFWSKGEISNEWKEEFMALRNSYELQTNRNYDYFHYLSPISNH